MATAKNGGVPDVVPRCVQCCCGVELVFPQQGADGFRRFENETENENFL